MKKSSMVDVAKRAGVSTATVSHVINGTRYVSEEVTRRVNQAIEELNYVPNQVARNLKAGKNHTVMFIAPDISNGFYSSVIEGAEGVLAAAGYRLVIANTKEDILREKLHLQGAGNGTVDGLLLASTATNWETVCADVPKGLPMVLVERTFPNVDTSIVCEDCGQALYYAVSALAKAGHTRIGFISGLPYVSSTRERLAAFRCAMEVCGLSVERGFIQQGGSEKYSCAQCCQALLSLRCTAVIVSDGALTMDVSYYYQYAPIHPELVGFVDNPWQSRRGDFFGTIALPSEKMGINAGEELLRLLAHPKALSKKICLSARFEQGTTYR